MEGATTADEERKDQKDQIKQKTTTKPNSATWTKMDKLLLTFMTLIHLGDGMEVYLPGVIGQHVSCDIELSSFKEGFLDCIQYFTLAIATVISGMLADRVGCRVLTLLSLYMSALSTIMSAVVGTFSALFLSRALIGFSVGLNWSVHCVLVARLISSKDVLGEMIVITGLMDTMGGVWAGLLGYLLLDTLGWRVFIVLTSLPLFLPAIIILHFVIQDEPAECYKKLVVENREENKEEVREEDEEVTNFVARIIKLSLFGTIFTFQGWGTILLVPTMIQLLKIKDVGTNTDCTLTSTKGAELLLLALVTFAAIPGRLFIHFTKKRISFRKTQTVAALLTLVSFMVMLLEDSFTSVIVTNLTVKLLYGTSTFASALIKYDEGYFGKRRYALGCSICRAMCPLGGAAGIATLVFTSVTVVQVVGLVLSVLQVGVVLSMVETDKRM
ncbi:hypothetical protein ACHWQZ_G019177 [Mnemiopsis leidyi]